MGYIFHIFSVFLQLYYIINFERLNFEHNYYIINMEKLNSFEWYVWRYMLFESPFWNNLYILILSNNNFFIIIFFKK